MSATESTWRTGSPPRRGVWLTRPTHRAGPVRWRYWFGPALGWGRAWARRKDAVAHGAGLRGFAPRHDIRRRASGSLLWASARAVAVQRSAVREAQLRALHSELLQLVTRVERALALDSSKESS